MSRGSSIVSIGSENAPSPDQTEQEQASAFPVGADEADAEDAWPDADEGPRGISSGWLMPAVACVLVLAWSGFFAWSRSDEFLSPFPPARIAGWITEWSSPVLLVCVAWLLTMRNSRREADRFGDAARLLSTESARLEDRLSAANRELSLAREFIAAQARDLESLGRVAAERLSANADRLQALVKENGAQVESIATVSSAALENMERLRGQLPVLASSAKDVTNNIANAGRTAHMQLQEMIEGFKRLNEFGQASERQVLSLRGQVNETISEFTRQAEQLDEIASARFAALAERGQGFRAELDKQEVEALAAIRTRAASLAEELGQTRELLDDHEAESLTSLRSRLGAVRDEAAAVSRSLREGEERALADWQAQLGRMEQDINAVLARLGESDIAAMQAARQRMVALAEEAQRFDTNLAERHRTFDQTMASRREKAETDEAETLERLQQKLAALDAELAERRDAHIAQAAELATRADTIGVQMSALEMVLAQVSAHGAEAESRVVASIAALGDKLAESREKLSGTDIQITGLTDATVRLLELIQASIQHSKKDLPAALASGEAQLSAMEGRVFALRDAAGEASSHGESLSAYVLAAQADLDGARTGLEDLHTLLEARNAAHARALSELDANLEGLAARSETLAHEARETLTAAIEKLATAAHEAVAGISTLGDEAIAGIAARLGEESAAAIDKAMHLHAAEAAGQLEQAAAHAAGVSREAAIQLRDQLAKVNELAGNLERRVAHARERAEEQVDNDFARRMALIADSLNSNAIDIAKVLSSEVSDTAWAAYLRGDRGIFTRRAVSLIDSGEARAISQVYESDGEFREHVSRYIHDFEGMLRQLLSTRDGHALGVTLLSSDMGKLYVALAQAIERLRS